ncbi:hypothetical protein NDU88_001902 [Pleurodeles waltl]|uniref:Uncharacterized protein n=1 Tax=Pleurodeles waltl TaxID=8319 RepID=A0AAV7T1N4_PLEWA|nr:hypothetical protein NDU88_001902 [Pleurodeles waltl]
MVGEWGADRRSPGRDGGRPLLDGLVRVVRTTTGQRVLNVRPGIETTLFAELHCCRPECLQIGGGPQEELQEELAVVYESRSYKG